jgi:hypothetical protein
MAKLIPGTLMVDMYPDGTVRLVFLADIEGGNETARRPTTHLTERNYTRGVELHGERSSDDLISLPRRLSVLTSSKARP